MIEELQKYLGGIIKDTKWENKVYFVGGCVRDHILGIKEIKDIDLLVNLPNGGIEFSKFLEELDTVQTKGHVVYERFGTAAFVLYSPMSSRWIEIECVMPRKEIYSGTRKPKVSFSNLWEDSIRRDFRCNSIYISVSTGERLDYHLGIDDISNKLLDCPQPNTADTFKDDPLRSMRAVRFSCQKGFRISNRTKSGILLSSNFLGGISKERRRDELNKILLSKDPIKGIRGLLELNLMPYVIPEFSEAMNFDQKSEYHHLNLGEHSLLVLQNILGLYPDCSLSLRLAALLHDLGKLTCFQIKGDGQNSYHGHEEESSRLSERILTDLKYPNNFISEVMILVKNHMRLKQGFTKKSIRKFKDNVQNLFGNCLILIDGDNRSHHPNHCLYNQINEIQDLLQNEKEYQSFPINGKDIIDEFKILQGPEVGKILSKAKNLYYENPNLTKEDLLRETRQILTNE